MSTVVHAIAGYFILLFVMRVLKRRPGSQMTMFEYVLVLLLGGVIILSTVGNDRSVTNCTCAVIVVGFIHRSLGWAKARSPRLGAILDGTPVVVIDKAQWNSEAVRETNLRHEDVQAAARGMALVRVEEIDYAILERNGQISVLKKES